MTKLKTVDIKGKDYVEVNERLKYFRANYKGYSLTSDIIEQNEKRCVIKASIKDPEGFEVATGCAYENAGSSFINKTSYIENCETSAWGRALGNFGIGIDNSVASYEEVATAIKNQDKPTKTPLKSDVQKAVEKTLEATETKQDGTAAISQSELMKRCGEMLCQMREGDRDAQKELMQEITTTDKFAGFKSFKGLSMGQVRVVYGKIKKRFKEDCPDKYEVMAKQYNW